MMSVINVTNPTLTRAPMAQWQSARLLSSSSSFIWRLRVRVPLGVVEFFFDGLWSDGTTVYSSIQLN